MSRTVTSFPNCQDENMKVLVDIDSEHFPFDVQSFHGVVSHDNFPLKPLRGLSSC